MLLPAKLDQILMDLFNLAIAYLLSFPIGLNREQEAHTAGVRTFPIVATACCGLAMLAKSFGASPDAYSRVLQGLVAGIGFVGGGAIVKDSGGATGTATAASIWSIGIVGAAVGLEAYHIAITLSVVNYLTLRYMVRWKSMVPPQS